MAQNPFDQFDSTTEGNPFDQFDGGLEKPKSSIVRRVVGDTGVSLLKGAISVPEAAVGIADIATGGRAGKVAEDGFGFRPKEAKEIISDLYSPEQKAANQKVAEADGFVDTIKTAVQNPSTIAQTVAESVPLIGAGGVVGLGARALGVSKPFIAGAIGEGAAGAGMAAEGIRQETDDGLLTGKQAIAASGSGLGTAAFGAAGGKLAQKLGLSDIDTLMAGGPAEAAKKGVARRIVEGGISEGVFEELPQSVQEQIWQNVALDQPLLDGVDNAAAMGLLAGTAMGGAASGFGVRRTAPATTPQDEFEAEVSAQEAEIRQRKEAAGIIKSSAEQEGDKDVSQPNVVTDVAAAAGGSLDNQPAGGAATGILEPNAGIGADAGQSRTGDQEVAPAQSGSSAQDSAVTPVDTSAHEAATSPVNDLPEPTDAQKAAGNYKVGRVKVSGLDISIENPHGSTRSGKDKDGEAWQRKMNGHYGYAKGVVARAPDKEHVDVNVKAGTNESFDGDVFIVNQIDPATGKFDEPKAYIGYTSQEEAEAAYRSNYAPDWKGMGGIVPVPMVRFKEMLNDEKAFLKPVSETSSTQAINVKETGQETPETKQELSPEPVQDKPLSAGPDNDIRPIIESIVKRRAAAAQMNRGKPFDRVLAAAKKMMAGESVKPGQLQIDVNQLKGDKHLHDAGLKLIDIAKDPAKAARAERTQSAEGYRSRISQAKTEAELQAIADEIAKDTKLTDAQAVDLDDAAMEAMDTLQSSESDEAIADQIADEAVAEIEADPSVLEPKPGDSENAAYLKEQVNERIEQEDGKQAVADAEGQAEADIADGSKESGEEVEASEVNVESDLSRVDAGKVLINAKDGYRIQKVGDKYHYSAAGNAEFKTEKLTRDELVDKLAGKKKPAEAEQAQPADVKTPEQGQSVDATSDGQPEGWQDSVSEAESAWKEYDRGQRAYLVGKTEYGQARFGKSGITASMMSWDELPQNVKRAISMVFFKNKQVDIGQNPSEVDKAKEALREAGVKGKDFTDAVKDVRQGNLTAEEVAEAHGAKTVPLKDTSDVGVEMSGNRRNKGLTLKDIQDANNDTERVAMAVKSKLWERPDYQALVDSGVNPVITHVIKQVYDSLSTKPAHRGEAMLYRYVETVEAAKKAVDDFLADENAMTEMIVAIAVKARQQSWMMNGGVKEIGQLSQELKASDGALNYFVDRIFPKNENDARWGRNNKEGNDKANATGNRFYLKTTVDLSMFIDAMKAVDQGFPAKQELWERSYQIKEKDGKFELVKKGRYSAISVHETREEAAEAARELVKRQREEDFKEPETPVEKAIRKGREIRANGNVSSQELKDAIGLKAVNFGNWMQQNSNAKERQAHVNSAFDAFHDLAEILNLPVKAMSLDGMLGLAIGAQGKGKFAAHFYPGYNEINLTRGSGAGSLAHEWAHGLDHYFGVQAGMATKDNPFASWIGSYRALPESDIRPEIVNAFKTIVETMRNKQETLESAKVKIEANAKSSKEGLDQYIERFDIANTLKGDAKAEAALDAIKNGVDDEYVEWPPLKGRRKPQGYVLSNVKIVADKMGWDFRSANDFNIKSSAHKYAQDALKKEPVLRSIHTEFYRNASGLDGGKKKAYWTTPHELFARAFEMYVADKLSEDDSRNDYLVAAWKLAEEVNTGDQFIDSLLNQARKRYPQGSERKEINDAFDVLFNEIKTKETDTGVMMFSRSGASDRTPFIAQQDEGYVKTLNKVIALFKSGDQQKVREAGRTPVPISRTPVVLRQVMEDDGSKPFKQQDYVVGQGSTLYLKADNVHSRSIHTGRISKDVLDRLPQLLADPIAVFKSSPASDDAKSFKVLLDAVDENGDPVIVAIKPNVPMQQLGNALVNFQATIFPVKWDKVREWNKEGFLRYYNEKSPLVSRPANNPLGTDSENSEDTQEGFGTNQTSVAASNPREAGENSPARDWFDANIGVTASKVKVISRGDIEGMNHAGYSRQFTGAGMPLERAQAIIDDIAKQYPAIPKVVVVADTDGLPIPRSIKNEIRLQRQILSVSMVNDVEGLFANGKIYINAGAIHSEARLREVFAHEAIGHLSVENMLNEIDPKLFRRLSNQVIMLDKSGNKYIRELAARVDETQAGLMPFARASEIIAQIAERGDEVRDMTPAVRSLWQKINDAIKAFAKLVFNVKMTDQDVRDIVGMANRYARGEDVVDILRSSQPAFSRSAENTGDFEFAREFLNELAFEDEAFRHTISQSQTLEGNIKSAFPSVEYLGEDTREDERDESGADRRFVFATPQRDQRLFYVYERGNKVWIDVSRLQPGDQGSAIYHGVANYALNTKKVFVGDPMGLSEDAVIRRTSNMLSSALRFGTTRHLEASKEQIKGVPDKGIEPLDWKGSDLDKTRALIYTFVQTLENQFPAIKDFRYDFARNQFIDSRGRPVDAERLERGARTDAARGARAGQASLRRGILIRSLASSESSEKSGLLENVLNRSSQLVKGKDRLQGLFSRSGNQDQTQTQQFKAWFGDSVVTDNGKPMSEGGKPLIVYHGTKADFNAFDMKKIGLNASSEGYGFYFTDDKSTAQGYKPKNSGNLIEAYISIQKPLDVKQERFGLADTKAIIRKMVDSEVDTYSDEIADYKDSFLSNFVDTYSVSYERAVSEVAKIIVDGNDLAVEQIAELSNVSGSKDNALSAVRDVTGFDGIKSDGYSGEGAGGGTIYVAWFPTQIKSSTGNQGTFDPENADIRFSRSGVAQQGLTPSWNAPEPSKMDNLIYALQDKNVDLRRVTQAIKKAGADIADRWNAYLQEELYHGRTAKRTKDFIKDELDPLIEDMRMRGVKMADFEEYLWARHAEERNKQIAKINPDMPDGGSGLTTAEAREYLAGLDDGTKKRYQDLARRVDAINKRTQQTLIDYGIESVDTIAAWNGAYKNYVPLMREDMDRGFGNGTGQGYSVKGNSAKRATGSKRAVVDIIANIAQQREKALIRGEKNRVATALIGLAELNPNKDFWKTDTIPMIKQVGRDGLVEERPDPNYKNRDNVVVARITNSEGKIEEHSVIFNEFDERAMRMAASIKNLDQDQIGELLGTAAVITRYFASINTQYNPIFGIINIVRDVQGAALNLSSTELAGKQKEVLGLTLPALKGIYEEVRARRKGKKIAGEWSELWEEFQKEGGQTGYRDMFRNSRERADKLEHALDPEWWQKKGWGKAISANGTLAAPQQWLVSGPGKALFDWLSDYNDTLENSVRLAAYKVGKDRGMSKQQAASIAKNLTVNFNRKGEMGRQIGSLYAFFNASIQGTARIAETIFKDGKMSTAGKSIVYGGMLLGAMQALALAAAGFDEDEPPEFLRDRNLIIPIGNGKYLSFPMPLGFNAIPATGRIITEWAMAGFKEPEVRFAHLLEVYMDMFNPIGYSGLSMQTLAPTMLDPLAALTENKDWTGTPIARNDFNNLNPTPGHTRAKDTASALSKGISYGINAITGGTEFKPGALSPTPDQIDYLFGQLTGGVGREAMKAEQTATSIVTGEELPSYKIPLAGRFFGDASGQASQGAAFYNNLRELNKHENQIKGMRKNGEDVTEYRKENPESFLINQAAYAEKSVRTLRNHKRLLLSKNASSAEIQRVETRITEIMKRLNDNVRLRKET